MSPLAKRSAKRPGTRSGRRAFTFIELVVAVGLSIVLLRVMYTIFTTATDLTRLSEEKSLVQQEASAVHDYIEADLARWPNSPDDYYLHISPDGKSIVFQATRLDAAVDTYVYIEYAQADVDAEDNYVYDKDDHSGVGLYRVVWRDRARNNYATEEDDAEDGSPMKIGFAVTSFQARYFDNTYDDFSDDDAWIQTPDLDSVPDPPTDRTRAVKFEMVIQNVESTGGLTEQTFTPICPIYYE